MSCICDVYVGGTCLNGLAEIRGDGIDQTFLYLPSGGGAWFGPPYANEGKNIVAQEQERRQLDLYGVGPGPGVKRVAGAPTNAATKARLRKQARCVVQDLTLVRSAEDAALPTPMLSVLSQSLELERVKIVARGCNGGGRLCTDGAGKLTLKQCDLREWNVEPATKSKLLHKTGLRAMVTLGKGGQLECKGCILPGPAAIKLGVQVGQKDGGRSMALASLQNGSSWPS